MKPVVLLAALPLFAFAALAASPAHAGGLTIDVGLIFGGGHRECAPRPVVIERPVVVERRVYVERPVCVERPVVIERPVCVEHRFERVVVERPVCVEPEPVRVECCEKAVVVRDECREDRHDYRHEERWHGHGDYRRYVRECR